MSHGQAWGPWPLLGDRRNKEREGCRVGMMTTLSYLVLFLFLPHTRDRHCLPHLQGRKHLPETTAPSLHPLLQSHGNMTSTSDWVEVHPEFIHMAQYSC